MRHFKEATLCDFMCSVYNNYIMNLLCCRRDNINSTKLAEGTVLTSKRLEVYKEEESQRERSEQQYRVESKV